jgi:hypothetical protein
VTTEGHDANGSPVQGPELPSKLRCKPCGGLVKASALQAGQVLHRCDRAELRFDGVKLVYERLR